MSLYLSLITAVQICVSFGIQWYTVSCFGAGTVTDALYTGGTIPQITTTLIIETLTTVLIPLLSAKKGPEEVQACGWQVLIGVGALFGLFSLLLYFVAPPFILLMIPGFSETGKQLAAALTRIQVIGLAGGACYAVLSALYQVRDRFIWPLLSVLASSVLGWLLLVWKLQSVGITLAAWVQVLVTTLPAILLLPGLGRYRSPGPNSTFFKQIWCQMRPLLLGKVYYMTSAPLDRILASYLAPGSIVILEMVGRFYGAVIRIMNQGLLTPTVPKLARLAQQQNWSEFRSLYYKQVRRAAVLSMLVITAIVSLRGLSLILQAKLPGGHVAGNLTTADLNRIWEIMIWMVGVLPLTCIGTMLMNAFYAMGDTRTPTKIGVKIFTLVVFLKAGGFLIGGIKGIVLAVTLGAALYCLWLEIELRRRATSEARESRRVGVEYLRVPVGPDAE